MTAYNFSQLIDFTRTSSGTFTDSTGKIASTPASKNLLTFTQEFDNAAWSKNNTTATADATTAPDGTTTADKLSETTTTAVHNAGQSITTTVQAYSFSCYVKAAERNFVMLYHTQSNASVSVNLTTGATGTASGTVAPTSSSVTSVGNGWWRVAMTVTATAASNFFGVYVTNDLVTASYAGTAGSGIFIWGAQLEQASAATTYTRNYGGRFPPRFDYDPVTLAPKGLLIEEQRTNLLTYSEQFDNVAWATQGTVTVAANATVSPDGTTSADAITIAPSNYIYQMVPITAGTTYTISCWVKAPSGTNSFKINTFSANNQFTSAELTATASWQRFTFTFTAIGTETTFFYPLIVDGFTGGTFHVWGAQLEAGAFATSYIPTVASQVTRTPDQTTMDGANFANWYNQSEGTFVISMDCPANGVRTEMSVDDGTINNMFRMRSQVTDPFFIARVGNANVVVLDGGTITANVPYTQANAYAVNNYGVSVNGGAAVTSASGAVPTVNRMTIGWESVGNYLNGHIRSIRYYPTRLSNAQLQALTA